MSDLTEPLDAMEPTSPKESSRKWYQSCGCLLVVTGFAIPVFVIAFAIFIRINDCPDEASVNTCSAFAVGLTLPLIFLFITVPFVIIGSIAHTALRTLNKGKRSQNLSDGSSSLKSQRQIKGGFPRYSMMSGLITAAMFINIFNRFFPLSVHIVISIVAVVIAFIAWRKKESFTFLAFAMAGLLSFPTIVWISIASFSENLIWIIATYVYEEFIK